MLELSQYCEYRQEKACSSLATMDNYVSTENMLPNKAGISKASSIPSTGKVAVFKKGDVLVSNIRPYFKKIWLADFDGFCSNDVLVLKAKSNCNSEYLYFLLSDDRFFSYATKTAKGTKMPRGDKVSIMGYLVQGHSRLEQDHIVSILAPLERKISINNQLNDYLLNIATAIFKKNFGYLEPQALLQDLCEVTMGQSPEGSSLSTNSEGTVFYQGKAEFGSFFPNRKLFTTNPKRMAQEGDVLLSVRAPVGTLNIANEKCCIGRGLAALSSPHQGFLYLTLRNLEKVFNSFNSEGTVFGSINRDALKTLPIYLPTNEELNNFSEIIEPIFKQIRLLDDQKRSLIQLRDALMPKLLSGEIQLPK